jgi:serine/threonine protein phosphatase 1
MSRDGTVRAEPALLTGSDERAEAMVTDADFSEEVAPLHRRFDVDEYDDIYVVGDVHGCLSELETLWRELGPGEDDLVVFVGDLIRKGPDSRGVVEFVHGKPNAYSVRGNNEAKLIHDRVDLPSLDPLAAYIESLPVAISWAEDMAVHGGVDPRRTLADHDVLDLLKTRAIPPENGYDGPFWFDLYEGPPRVFFGHTVLDAPVDTEWAIGLDTGCVYGGALTAYDYYGDSFVSVPAEATYKERADRKIIQP